MHLQALYIDQEGEVHRVQKVDDKDKKKSAESNIERADDFGAAAIGQALDNISRRYSVPAGKD